MTVPDAEGGYDLKFFRIGMVSDDFERYEILFSVDTSRETNLTALVGTVSVDAIWFLDECHEAVKNEIEFFGRFFCRKDVSML